jgi:hypothetical protein
MLLSAKFARCLQAVWAVVVCKLCGQSLFASCVGSRFLYLLRHQKNKSYTAIRILLQSCMPAVYYSNL